MGNRPSDLRRCIRWRDVQGLRYLMEKTRPSKTGALINNDYAQDCIMDSCSPAVGNAFYYAVKNSYNDPTIVGILLEYGADVHSTGLNDETPLHFSARLNGVRVSQVLISHGANINVTDDRGKSPMHSAALSPFDTTDSIKYFYYETGLKEKVNATDYNGNTPLHDAASANNPGALRTLLDLGSDVNAKSKSGNTPLDLAVKDSQCWAMLTQHNAGLTAQANQGEKPEE